MCVCVCACKSVGKGVSGFVFNVDVCKCLWACICINVYDGMNGVGVGVCGCGRVFRYMWLYLNFCLLVQRCKCGNVSLNMWVCVPVISAVFVVVLHGCVCLCICYEWACVCLLWVCVFCAADEKINKERKRERQTLEKSDQKCACTLRSGFTSATTSPSLPPFRRNRRALLLFCSPATIVRLFSSSTDAKKLLFPTKMHFIAKASD